MRSPSVKLFFLTLGLLVSLLAVPSVAQAQAEPLKLQVGASFVHIDFSGIGVTGAIVKPLGPKGPGSLEIVAGAGFFDVDGLSVIAFGAGPRLLFKPNGKMTPFVQALVGITHSDAGNDFGVAPGAGVVYAYSEKMNIVGEFDIAALHTDFGTRTGFRMMGAIRIPIGQK